MAANRKAAPLPTLGMDELRARRADARRNAELAHLRAKQGVPSAADSLAALDARVDALTEELIARYAADLTLVDSLLEPAYPAKVATPTVRKDGR
ncbi:MAG: hypothetical protein NTX29_08500 [Actinobacteria bacterium]|nr:hypothetical protein [Actinomycetota bacterium]